jgi:type VI protein secretion system component Hcp
MTHFYLRVTEGSDIFDGAVVRGGLRWVEVDSMSWGDRGSIALGAGSPRPDVLSATFMRPLSPDSPKLMLASASGRMLGNVRIEIANGEGDDENVKFTFDLTDVVVSSYQQSGGGGSGTSMETFTFNFRAKASR